MAAVAFPEKKIHKDLNVPSKGEDDHRQIFSSQKLLH